MPVNNLSISESDSEIADNEELPKSTVKRLNLVPGHTKDLKEIITLMQVQGKADSHKYIYSENDCITLTNSLNAQLHQVSARIVKACIYPDGHGSTSGSAKFASISDEDLSQIQSIRPVLGELAYNNLLERRGCSVYNITHCAVQATLAALCEMIIKVWSFKKDEHELLSKVYNSMRSAFDDPVSTGTWRCLTRAQTKTPSYHNQKESILHSFATEIAKVLLLDGYPYTLDDATENIYDFFAEDLFDLYDCCFRLDRVANEGVHATDIKVYRPEPGDAFEEELMYVMASSTEVDNDPNPGISKDSRCEIAFACHLGLLDFGTDSKRHEGIYTEEVLLKAAIQLPGLFFVA